MSAAISTSNWRGQPSEIGKTLAQPSKAPAKDHPLRNSEASKVRSKSRNPTANISGGVSNTQKQKPQVAETA